MTNAIVDERTLREIYLPAFEASVRAGVASVMVAYNGVNGTNMTENGPLLNGLLRRPRPLLHPLRVPRPRRRRPA